MREISIHKTYTKIPKQTIFDEILTLINREKAKDPNYEKLMRCVKKSS